MSDTVISSAENLDPRLLPYQKEAVTRGLNNDGRILLYMDAGTGKTFTAIEIVLKLVQGYPKEHKRPFRILCCGSSRALATWMREWPKWSSIGHEESDICLVRGTPKQRKALWQKPSQVYLCTAQVLYVDKGTDLLPKEWDVICVDECRLFRNPKAKMLQRLRPLLRKTRHLILMDGTLVVNGPGDLWGCLNLLDFRQFPSYWRFVGKWCIMIEGIFGTKAGGPKMSTSKELQQTLVPYIARVKEDNPEVRKTRPKLTRDYIPIEMSEEQREIYLALHTENLAETVNGELVFTVNALDVYMKCRQLLVCPKILDKNLDYGPAMNYVVDELEDDPHIVIFTPFTRAIPHIYGLIKSRGYPEPFILQGGDSPEKVQQTEKEFHNSLDRAIIISTKFADSFELPSAKQCFHLGYEWNPDMNEQAEKRLHRVTTPHPVNSWYMIHVGTIDELMKDILNRKHRDTVHTCLLYTSPSPRDRQKSRMPSSA